MSISFSHLLDGNTRFPPQYRKNLGCVLSQPGGGPHGKPTPGRTESSGVELKSPESGTMVLPMANRGTLLNLMGTTPPARETARKHPEKKRGTAYAIPRSGATR